MDNSQVASVFEHLADLLEIDGANPFRIRAYRNAARTLQSLTQPIAALANDPDADLKKLAGIGKDLAAQIRDLLSSGRHPLLEELRAKIPPGVVSMLNIPGVGPKKVAVFFSQLGLTTLDELKAAAEAGELSKLKGFGAKTEKSILEGIAVAAEAGQRFSIADATEAAHAIANSLSELPSVGRVSVAGSCRRRKESCGDLDILATADDPTAAMDALAAHSSVVEVLQRGETKQRVRLQNGMELDLRVVPDESFGAAMQYFTGSKEHNVVIRRRAKDRGLKVNEYGVFRGDELVAGHSEEEVYQAVDLPWIVPELRENRGEIEAAEDGTLPNLLEVSDICSDLHMHTTASDGNNTIAEMADAAVRRGYRYIAITDHSKRVSMANGLDAERLRAHWKEIREVNAECNDIEILCGIECDILEDATMDLPDDVLEEADWVIGVLHYGLKQKRTDIMKRLLHAIEHPAVDCIGHLTGRLVGRRPGADMDVEEVLQAARENQVLMEINAHPKRLDLCDVHAARARELEIPIVINTDAHSIHGYDVLPYGVDQARRAALTASDVANTLPLDEFRRLLKRHR